MSSIRFRLVLLTTLSIAAIFGISGFGIYYFAHKDHLKGFDERLQVHAYSIMTSTFQKENESGEIHFADRFLEEFSGSQRRTFYQIWKDNDQVLKRSESLGNLDLPIRHGENRTPSYWNLELPNGLSGRAIGIRYTPRIRGNPALDDNDGVKIILVVATDLNQIESSLAQLRNLLLLGGILTLLSAPIFVLMVLKNGLAPLKYLASRMGKVDASTLETHIDERNLPSELKPIAKQLNELLSRLRRSFERERQFSADVSHELRTPIAALLNISEVGIKWKTAESKQDYEAIQSISGAMQQTVSQLLDLSRAENGNLDLHREPLAIDDFVSQIWSQYSERAREKELIANFVDLEAAVWTVDRTLFERMLDNLIENAVTYTPVGGELSIEVSSNRDRLIFRNTCTELEAADLDKLFDRFWRKDCARSNMEHNGLGLAVVAAFAAQQGLRLHVCLLDESTFEISISFEADEN